MRAPLFCRSRVMDGSAVRCHRSHRFRGNKPMIFLSGNETVYLPVNPEAYYEDPGARCRNAKGEDFSRRIVIGGQSVDRSEPGTYFTKYACSDEKGNKAEDVYRQIIVQGSQNEANAKHREMRRI